VLLKQAALHGIANGTITIVFRRWTSPRVKAGATFRTVVGVIGIDSVEPVAESALTDRVAREAGFESRQALLAELANWPDGELYRVAVRLAGPDPRWALREDVRLSDVDVDALARRLASLGARTKDGPWALPVMRLIAKRPGVLAARLATSLGIETALFKPRVRQLKELGLTESLEVGYRLSPRGHGLLRALEGRRTRTGRT
jgi:hypothetical protein